ncbi:hypothetical protein [Oceaniglobus trochenteri]|uniref:hypothetical protein n=1 Tax=Oceaniglobus trochenteri TaxID=2763260 RepID=UPI001CFF87C4|nr:hypothetical protein [Oceaniglobus trochenteri]
MESNAADPKGLIRESYRIDGIRPEECRSIFLDWALSLAEGVETKTAIAGLLQQYEAANPDHPMNQVLRDGLAAAKATGRRGGRAGRVAQG